MIVANVSWNDNAPIILHRMRRQLLAGTDLTISTLCLGTADIGLAERGKTFDGLVNAYRDAGGNLLDTAHCYCFWRPDGAGCSETAVADYIARNGRGDLILSTKGGHPSGARYRRVDRYLSRQRITADLEDSLARLDVDTIDLYWLHRDDLRESVESIVDMMNDFVRSGVIRHFAASNWTRQRIEAANTYAKRAGLRGFVASQPMWSLGKHNHPGMADTHMTDDADVAWHEQTQLPIFTWNATGRGYFATNGRAGSHDFENPINRARLERVNALARQLGCTPGQLALAYLLNHPFPVFVLLGTRNVDNLHDAIGADNIRLTREQLAHLHG